MNRCLRVLLICLCVLALPLQGWAAQTMLACGLLGHGAGSAPAASLVVATVVDHGSGHHCHGHGQGKATVKAHSASPSGVHAKAASAGKCSACAVCCVGVVMVGHDWAWPAVTPQGAPVLAPVAVGRPSVTPRLLERPPRVAVV